MLHVYVGMGSNLGDRAGNLLLGVRGMLAAGLRVRRLSSIYETEPVGGGQPQPAYLNAVAEIDGEQLPAPEPLLARLLRIEHALGRRRERPLAPRTLDLDLLLYGDSRAQTELLTLPHPRLHLRRFVLAPLAELAPDAPHPVIRLTFSELLAARHPFLLAARRRVAYNARSPHCRSFSAGVKSGTCTINGSASPQGS